MDNNELLIAISDMFEKKVEEVKNEVADTKNHMGVIAEDLKSDLRAVAEGHDILNNKLDTLDKKVDAIDKKIDNRTNELKLEMKIVRDYVIDVDTKLNEHEVILKRVK